MRRVILRAMCVGMIGLFLPGRAMAFPQELGDAAEMVETISAIAMKTTEVFRKTTARGGWVRDIKSWNEMRRLEDKIKDAVEASNDLIDSRKRLLQRAKAFADDRRDTAWNAWVDAVEHAEERTRRLRDKLHEMVSAFPNDIENNNLDLATLSIDSMNTRANLKPEHRPRTDDESQVYRRVIDAYERLDDILVAMNDALTKYLTR